MWLVKLALRQPHTIAVLALFILILGSLSAYRSRTDILPEIDLPVISVIWTYRGMDTTEFEKRVRLQPHVQSRHGLCLICGRRRALRPLRIGA
jgi:multidrug efflux pump subunit AcrB